MKAQLILRKLITIPTLAGLMLASHVCRANDASHEALIESSPSIRGAIYIPYEAYNAPQMWKNFSLPETRRDFGYAHEIHLNALRIWASYEYWQTNPRDFKTSFDQMLGAAHDAGIRVLISLFEEDGVPPTPENMWTTNPATAFDIQSPGLAIAASKDRSAWEKPRSFLKWFMENYRNDDRLLAIEVMNEPNGLEVPFAKSMFRTAKSMQGTVPLTIGSDSVRHALQYIPLGLDVIEFHNNYPITRQGFESSITNAIAVGKANHLPVWLTEWQRLRPGGSGWGRTRISESESTPDYASLAPIVQKYPIGNFFWSLMIKRAYLPPQRRQGTVNGLFWPDGSAWSLEDARAIAREPSLNLAQKGALPPGYLDYMESRD